MKTKITTIIGLVALGIIGFTSNNATAANNVMSSLITVETKTAKAEAEKPLEMVEGITEEEFLKAAEIYTALGSDKEIEKYAAKQIKNSTEANTDFFNDAESFTASGSDKEIEKYAEMQMSLLNEKESR